MPPLGLADTDPREQRRQQVNAHLLQRFEELGANAVVDLASAVRAPASPNQINPAYLTAGMPNNAYHDAIAQAIAGAATRLAL